MECFESLVALPSDPPVMREKCPNCSRPVVACWCGSLPAEPLVTESRVVILQHPAEQRRCLRTAEMLSKALLPGKCLIFRGKRFPQTRHAGLAELLLSKDSVVVYPSREAVDVHELPTVRERGAGYNLILIDGTWPQAKAIYHNTSELHSMPQVKFAAGGRSQYVIRSQPAEGCLSTVEAAAAALEAVEARGDGLSAALVAPLSVLCRVQLDHGAVTHDTRRAAASGRAIGKRLDRYLNQFP